jgi:hypothetical protein
MVDYAFRTLLQISIDQSLEHLVDGWGIYIRHLQGTAGHMGRLQLRPRVIAFARSPYELMPWERSGATG